MTIYTTSNGETVNINIPEGCKTIGLMMSGGADSSMLCYLLSKEIIENNLDVKIQPLTWRRTYPAERPKDWNIKQVQKVLSTIDLLLGTDDVVKPQHVFIPAEKGEPIEDRKLEAAEWDRMKVEARDKLGVDVIFYGTTSNPPYDEMVKHGLLEEREVHRDKSSKVNSTGKPKGEQSPSKISTKSPFLSIDKSVLRELYIQNGVLDTLEKSTKSCEGIWQDTENYTKPCGKCWWCRERKWAGFELR